VQPGTSFGPRHRRFSLRATTPPADSLPRSTAASLDAVLVPQGQLGPSARSWHNRRNAKRFALAQPPQTASPGISLPSLRGGGETSATTSPQPASLSPPGRTRRWLSSLTQSPVPRSPSQSAGAPLGDHPPASECAPTTRRPMHTAPADSGRGHKALSSRCATRNAGLLSKTARNSWTIPQLAQLPSILSGLSRTPGPQGTQPCQEPRVRSSSKAEHESQVFNPVVIPNRHCRETNRGQPKSGTQRRSSPTHHSRQKLGHRVPKGGRGIIPPARSIPPISPGCDRPTSLSQAIEPRAPSPEPYRAAGIRS
jgi:hypothetical protein